MKLNDDIKITMTIEQLRAIENEARTEGYGFAINAVSAVIDKGIEGITDLEKCQPVVQEIFVKISNQFHAPQTNMRIPTSDSRTEPPRNL